MKQATSDRKTLWHNGYCPLPLNGKNPDINGKGWQLKRQQTSDAEIDLWAATWPDCKNTGLLARYTPFLDLDITDRDAADACTERVFEKWEDIPCRVGAWPKCGHPFRCDTPFAKITVDLTAPNGKHHRIEFLADGQQFAAFGIHPDTKLPYTWHGGSPLTIRHDQLPEITEAEAKALVDELVALLEHDYGYKRKETPKNTAGDGGGNGGDNWHRYFADLIDHDNDAALAMALLVSGMNDGAAVNMGRALIELYADKSDPERLARRLHEWPGMVRSARNKIGQQPPQPTTGPTSLPFHTFDEEPDIAKNWIIKDVIARGEVSSWIGPPGATKSALLTDIGLHAAAAAAWRTKMVTAQTGVIYFALERGILVRRRLVAYRKRDDLPSGIPFATVSRVINLLDPKCVPDIVNTIKAAEDKLQNQIGLVVIDTFSKGIAAGGGDENSAKDQNIVAANMRRIIERANVHIAGIGHTGKDETRGERGSNARLADVDLQVSVNGTDAVHTATITKANDQDPGDITAYALERVMIGVDPLTSEEISTTIVDNKTMIAPASAKGRPKGSKYAKVVMELLSRAVQETGALAPANSTIPSTARTINTRDFFVWYSAGLEVNSDKPDTKRRTWDRALVELQASGMIGVWNGTIWIK